MSRCFERYIQQYTPITLVVLLVCCVFTPLILPGCGGAPPPQEEKMVDPLATSVVQEKGRLEKITRIHSGGFQNYNTDILIVDGVEYIVVYNRDKIAIIKHTKEGNHELSGSTSERDR